MSTDPATLAALQTLAGTVRITAVEAIPFALPYRRPPAFASGTVSSADNVLVRVHTDAGLVGQAEAQPRPYTYGETQASIVDAVERTAQRGADGRRPAAPRARRRALRRRRRQLRRARRRRPRRLGPRRPDPRLPVPHAARRLRGRRRGRAHGLVRRAGRDGRGGDGGQRAARASTPSRSRSGARRTLDVAAVRAIREALPDADLYVDANRGWSYDDAVRAGDALVELGVRAIEEPISVEDRAGRLRLAERWAVPLGGDESCISLAHVDRALEEGAVRVVSVKTARTGLHGVAPDPRSLPRAQRPGRSSAASTRERSAPRRRSRSPPRSPRPPASRPRSRTSSTSPTISSSPRRRSATAARRSRAAPGLGVEVDEERLAALPGGPLMLFMAEMEVRLPPDMPAEQADELKAREREYSQAPPARRALAAPVAGRRPLRERERARRRLGRRAARAALRPAALSLSGHSRHAAGAPSQRHRPRRRRCLTAPTC